MNRSVHWFALLVISILTAGCATTPAEPHVVRVLSYNIHHGRGVDGEFDYDRLAGVILSARPDVVALQEVDRGTGRAAGVDQPAMLAQRTELLAIFGAAMDHDGGEYGEALLLSAEPVASAVHPLPHSAGHEPRAAVSAVLRSADALEFQAVGTHLDHTPDPADREAQATRLVELFGHGDAPCLLIGDLNATPDSSVMRILFDRFDDGGATAGSTFPSDVPERRIDYVLYRPRHRWRVLESRVLDEAIASDHRPLLVVLELLPE